jgi:hypothetical protein
VDGLGKTERDVAKLMKQIKEVEEAVDRLKTARREAKRLTAAAAESDGALRELDAQEQSLRRQAESVTARAAELENRSVAQRGRVRLCPFAADPRVVCVAWCAAGSPTHAHECIHALVCVAAHTNA